MFWSRLHVILVLPFLNLWQIRVYFWRSASRRQPIFMNRFGFPVLGDNKISNLSIENKSKTCASGPNPNLSIISSTVTSSPALRHNQNQHYRSNITNIQFNPINAKSTSVWANSEFPGKEACSIYDMQIIGIHVEQVAMSCLNSWTWLAYPKQHNSLSNNRQGRPHCWGF